MSLPPGAGQLSAPGPAAAQAGTAAPAAAHPSYMTAAPRSARQHPAAEPPALHHRHCVSSGHDPCSARWLAVCPRQHLRHLRSCHARRPWSGQGTCIFSSLTDTASAQRNTCGLPDQDQHCLQSVRPHCASQRAKTTPAKLCKSWPDIESDVRQASKRSQRQATLKPRARCSYSRPGCGQKQKLMVSTASRYCTVLGPPSM